MLHRVIRCYAHIHSTKGSTRESQGDTKCYIVLSGVTLTFITLKVVQGDTKCYIVLSGVTLTFTVLNVVHGSNKVIPSVTSCYQVLHSHS